MSIPNIDELISSDELLSRMEQFESLPRWQGRKKEIEDRLQFAMIAARDEHIKHLRFTDPSTDKGYYAPFDCWLFSGDSWFFVEIKMRSKNSTAYPGWMIEESKASEMEWLTKETGKASLLVTIHPDRTLVWNLAQEHSKQVIQCPDSTMYRTRTKPKQVRLYPTATASSPTNQPL